MRFGWLWRRLLEGKDVGASVAVYVGDEPVVDLWGGYADAQRTRLWERDTITCVWSTTKTMTALCALILADRGLLDLDAPVAQYWPEFGAAGKENVLVRHVLGHTSGLPTWQQQLRTEQLYDWSAMTRLLAEQAPATEPGAVGAYHSITQGYLIGEIVRRVTGQELAAFFAEEVAGPLGADFQMRVRPEDDHRVAETIPPPTRAAEFLAAGDANPPVPAEIANTEAWRRADIPRPPDSGTRDRSRPCSPSWQPAAHCFREPALSGYSSSSSPAWTRSWAGQSAREWATACRAGQFRGAAGVARW